MTTPRHFPFLVIAAIAIICGLGLASQLIVNGINQDQRRADNAARDAQFCKAIPDVAGATAKALVDIIVAQAIKDGTPEAEIERTRVLGAAYVKQARVNASSGLTTCHKESP